MQQKILKRVKNAVLKIEPSAEIILFGSRARNDYTTASDWDFLILVDGDVDYVRTDRIRHLLHEIGWDTGEVLSCIVRSRIVWESPQYRVMPLYAEIKLEGIKI